MKKTISVITLIIFLASIYFIPSLSAITLGEIKPDKQESESVKKTNEPENLNKNKPEEKKTERYDNTDKKTDEKEEVNPRLVCLLSVIMPGGGHFYLNNDAKGFGFCLAAGIGYTATGYFMVKTMLADSGTVAYKNYLLLTGFLFFITIVVHFVGIIEAYSDAEEMNKEKLFGNDDNNPFITEFVLR
ncbi:MAG TPA: hypothetical protein PLY36_14830 [Spirochaetota bacterium]|nr:hypothetical protein [Spirochaetota bacterium]